MANLGAIGGFLQGFTQTFQQMQEHQLRKKRAAVDELEAGNRTKLLDAQIKRMGEESAHQKQLEKNAQSQMAMQEQNIQFRRDEAKASLIQTQMGSFPIEELRSEEEQAQFNALQGELDAVFTQPSPGDFSGGGASAVEALGQTPAAPATAPAATQQPAAPSAQPGQQEAIPILPEETAVDSLRLRAVDALRQRGMNTDVVDGQQVIVFASPADKQAALQDKITGRLIAASGLGTTTIDEKRKIQESSRDLIGAQMMDASANLQASFNTAAFNAEKAVGMTVTDESVEEFEESGGAEGFAHPIQITQNEDGIPRLVVGSSNTPESIHVIARTIESIREGGLGSGADQGAIDMFESQASIPIQMGLALQTDSIRQDGQGQFRYNRFGRIPVEDFMTVSSMLDIAHENASAPVKQNPVATFRLPTEEETARDFDIEYGKNIREIPVGSVTPLPGTGGMISKPSEEKVNASVQERSQTLAVMMMSATDSSEEVRDLVTNTIERAGKKGTDDFTKNYINGPVNPDLRELMNELRKRVGLSFSRNPRNRPAPVRPPKAPKKKTPQFPRIPIQTGHS